MTQRGPIPFDLDAYHDEVNRRFREAREREETQPNERGTVEIIDDPNDPRGFAAKKAR